MLADGGGGRTHIRWRGGRYEETRWIATRLTVCLDDVRQAGSGKVTRGRDASACVHRHRRYGRQSFPSPNHSSNRYDAARFPTFTRGDDGGGTTKEVDS